MSVGVVSATFRASVIMGAVTVWCVELYLIVCERVVVLAIEEPSQNLDDLVSAAGRSYENGSIILVIIIAGGVKTW
jgi:hypothetical protein